MAKRVAAEYKTHDSNEIRNHAEHEIWQGKHVTNILIQYEKEEGS